MSELIVGVDLGGTNARTAIVSRDKKILGKDSRPTRADEGPTAVMDCMAESVEAALKSACGASKDVLAAHECWNDYKERKAKEA